MKAYKKIILLVVAISASYICSAQTEHGLLPFSNNLLLNPSFAGFDRASSTWSNMQIFAGSAKQINHSFTITHDSWSDKSKAATAWYFYHGLTGEVNTNHSGAGYTFAKPIPINDGEFVPSANLNYWMYTKQWLVYLFDGQLDKTLDPYKLPGKKFFRYSILTPRIGLLWNSPIFTLGISASYSHRHFELEPVSIGNAEFAQKEYLPKEQSFHMVLHYSQKMRGKQNGLESQPFKASPELVVLYSDQLLLSRAGFRMEQTKNLMAMFIQNNYTDNIHGIAAIFGWRNEIIHFSLTAGGAYSIPTKKPALFGEISLGMVVPYNFVNMLDPFAPPKNPF